VRVYRFIDHQKASFAIRTLCRVCGVARASYYAWAAQAGEPAEPGEAALADRIRAIWAAARGRYGVPRVTAQLRREGPAVNHKRVERLMAAAGLQGLSGRRRVRTTVRDPRAPLAPDRVERQFHVTALDRLWVGDITYIPTGEGWLYLATVLDACSRRVLGWSLADALPTQLCLDALQQAVATRGGGTLPGVVFHSDHGCQYTSREYGDACRVLGIAQSMGTIGDSYDNAMAESFFASLKRELVDRTTYATHAAARVAVFQWLVWYNRSRLHSALGYCSPEEFEARWQDRAAA